MGLRREMFQIIFGALGFALALQMGWIKPQGPFWDNAMWGFIVMVGSRVLAFMLGGRK